MIKKTKNLQQKKSLGQNFLNSEGALNAIIEAGKLTPDDFVLEIGPGEGALTSRILKAGAKILAIEKDNRLIDFLNEKYKEEVSSGQLKIIEGDILNFDSKDLPDDYKIISNIPYYITGEITERFLSAENQPSQMVLLVQKEVADRIVARDKKESIYSISIKVYSEPKIIKKVPAGSFTPAPKVDSAIISLENVSKKVFIDSGVEEKRFFEVLKRGFAHKRKILSSNLKEVVAREKFETCDIDLKSRAETLTISDWICLSKD